MKMTIDNIRNSFLALSMKVYGRPLIYLDNAATSQRPNTVMEKWNEMSLSKNANIHRAVHFLASEATEEYESTRDAVREFINAKYREEIIFTSGTTASINLLAFCFGERYINPGDEIMIAESEHHSDIIPWQLMCQRKSAVIKVIPVDDNGYLDIDYIVENISEKTKILCVAAISNVLGIRNDIKRITGICHKKNCKVLVDGAQGIVHDGIDVQETDCDFYVFSGHKIYAATGTGVLYGKKEFLDEMPPYMGGGEMIDSVSFEKSTFAPLPGKFEAGTQNFSSVPTLKPALEFARLMRNETVESEQEEIIRYMSNSLLSDERIQLYGKAKNLSDKSPLFSISVKGVHHEDLALILDKMGVAVRSGQMCAEPLMTRFGVTGMLRVSFAPYNTLEEAKCFIECLNKAIGMLV